MLGALTVQQWHHWRGKATRPAAAAASEEQEQAAAGSAKPAAAAMDAQTIDTAAHAIVDAADEEAHRR